MFAKNLRVSFTAYVIATVCVLAIVPLAVVALMLLHRVHVGMERIAGTLVASAAIGLAVASGGGLLLSMKVKRVLNGQNPYEFARRWREREAMLEAVHEGILAVNSEARIVVANRAVVEMFRHASLYKSPMGEYIGDFFPGSHMRTVMRTGLPEYDQEVNLNGYHFFVDNFPVLMNGQVVGAISTFRDKTELKKLAEQLTGIKLYTDALRLQTHEFMNKLHVILGMIHVGSLDTLIDYIHQITNQYQLEVGAISSQIKDPVFVGFLLSKASCASELDVKLGIVTEGNLPIPQLRSPELADDVITVVGNLLDNAFEAVKNNKVKAIEVAIRHTEGRLTVAVKDNGDGISYRIQGMIFEKSFSTKGKNRGYGLYLTKQRMERIGGSLSFKSTAEGTTFIADFPL